MHTAEFLRGHKRLYMTATPRIYGDNELRVDDASKIIGCWKALAKQGLTEEIQAHCLDVPGRRRGVPREQAGPQDEERDRKRGSNLPSLGHRHIVPFTTCGEL